MNQFYIPAGVYYRNVRTVVYKDSTDYASIFFFENTSEKLVRITYRGKTEFLEPGEKTQVKVSEYSEEMPEVTTLNNGVS
jgi:hypothetical protein